MTIINPPLWLQSGTYSAQADRLPWSALVERSGVATRTHFTVTATPTPSKVLNVSEGYAFVRGTSIGFQGAYIVANSGDTTVTIPDANDTYGRIDLIVVRVYDSAVEGGALNTAVVEVVPGSAVPSPTAPTLPANSVEVARVTVPASASTITNTNIAHNRKMIAKIRSNMSSLPETVSSSDLWSLQGLKHSGEQYFVSDRAATYMFDGAKHVPLGGDTGWLTLPLTSAWAAYNASYLPRYRIKNGLVLFDGLVRSTSGSPGTNNVIANLPVAARPDIQTQKIIATIGNNNQVTALGIYPNGQILYKGGAYSTWISISGIPPYPVANI